ncbi:hypothetical protein [Mycolicibacterium nivoides]|uniref:PE domain-containing protein n=1 Tax=Mycolicibacterium nivoides TaxID=2487344 RepID=A0ABW9LN35_9MYCO
MTTENNDPNAIVTEGLRNAASQLRAAEAVFQVSTDTDIQLGDLPQAERFAYATACATIASAHAAIAQVQAQAILQEQLHDVLAALKALINAPDAPETPEAASGLVAAAFPTR